MDVRGRRQMAWRVLVVDDEPAFRALTRMVLEPDAAFQIVGEASDGAGAVSAAEALRPDLVLLDLRMPGMSGLEALPKLRVASPSSRIVVVSIMHDEGPLHQAKMAGAAGFIDKALDNDAFVAAVHQVMATSSWAVHRRPVAVL